MSGSAAVWLLVAVVLAVGSLSCAAPAGQPGKHEGERAGLVGRERLTSPSSPVPRTIRPAARPSVHVSRSATRPPAARTVWDALADCESSPTGWDAAGRPIPGSADWHLNDGSGYYGGLQFIPSTWAGYGGLAYAPRADLATREQQIAVAARVQADQGWTAWPVCSRKVGLR